jgi:RNA polymerase sigma-70 factor, ECF subfamily
MSGNHDNKPTESVIRLRVNAPTEELHRRHAEFADLEQRYGTEVWAIGYARCQDKHEAEDIKQETFLRLWQQWNHGVAVRKPQQWLRGVARHVAEDFASLAFRRNGTQSPETMSGIQSREPTPLELLEREETVKGVNRERAALPAIDREIVRQQLEMDRTYHEIAEERGLTDKAVKGRLARCKTRLRVRLKHLDPSS